METVQTMDSSWVTFIGGLGVGSIAAAAFQHYLARRAWAQSTRFVELRDAFTGVLTAIARLDHEGEDVSPDALANYEMWKVRVQLVASKDVIAALATWRDPEPNTDERNRRLAALFQAMRRDLGIGQ